MTAYDNGLQALILGAVFLSTVLMIVGTGYWFLGDNRALKRRLQEIANPGSIKKNEIRREGAFTVYWLEPMVKSIMPNQDSQRSHLRTRLIQAGFRGNKAMVIFLATKIIAAFLLPALIMLPLYLSGFFSLQYALIALSIGGLLGFFIPDLVVTQRRQERQLVISESFPDALDMLVVCVEAGLSLDAAIQRVSKELSRAHPAMAEELSLVTLELRAGKARDAALRGIAERTGADDLNALASILIQAGRFGTSITSALREFSNEMRTIRIQKARERAAKLPVKLIFPIMLCIFPALFLVILGPAAVRIYTGLGAALDK